MNIPARHCAGYLGDIGVAIAAVMDFSARFDAYLSGCNNQRRIGRILMANGRDAADLAIAKNTLGRTTLS